MKAYLIITGVIFGLIVIAHVMRMFAEPHLWSSNPVEFISMVVLTLLAAGLSIWAWRLLRRTQS